MMVDYIILSVNEDYNYYGILPIISAAYRKFFYDAKIVLGVLDTVPEKTIAEFRSYCDTVKVFEKIKGVPTCNQGKLMRFYIASGIGNKTCMINDVDTIPLQRKFFVDRYAKRKPGQLLAIGAELYAKTENRGKFPISYMAGEGSLFDNIFNVGKKTWPEFVGGLRGLRVIDGKENIRKPLGQFSDESLIRAIKKDTLPVLHLKRVFRPAIDSVARRSKFSVVRLQRGGYFEAHHLHPIETYKSRLVEIAKYIGVKEPYFICR